MLTMEIQVRLRPYSRYLVGDAVTRLRNLPNGSVDLVLTSPPFLGLRSYLPEDDPNKTFEIGTENSPAQFISQLLAVVRELRRVLAEHGSLVVELGDTYAGSGGAGGDYRFGGKNDGQPLFRQRYDPATWPQKKSMTLVPELFRIALAYGFNPLEPKDAIEPWIIRNVVRWQKQPKYGAMGDKFRPSLSDMVVACKSTTRYFDGDSVKTASKDGSSAVLPTDIWSVPVSNYRGEHFATWPLELLTTPITAMCPPLVCLSCGTPTSNTDDAASCGHCGKTEYRPGVVLDPFVGSGTTLMAAAQLSRSGIGIDLNVTNFDLAKSRPLLGMLLENYDESVTQSAS